MNIIFLEAVQTFGGARKSTLELAKRLKDRGDNVYIIDLWGSCTPFIEEAERLEVPVKLIDKRNAPIVLSHPNKVKAALNYYSYIFKVISYRRKIAKLLEDIDTDLVVVNNVKCLSLLRKSKKYKIAFFARGWFLPHTMRKRNKVIIKKLADIYIGVSQATRQAIFVGGFANLEDIYVVPNAIDFDKMQHLLSKKNAIVPWDQETNNRPFTMLHCGGFLPSKGQHVTIEVAKELKKQNIDFKIKLIGIIYKGGTSQKYFDKIEESIAKASLEDNIEIILNKPNVDEYFVETDVLIHPSSTEGLPRVVMEAMSVGKPVIGNAVGGMTDYILNGYTGYLTNYNAVEEYLVYINLLLNDKFLYRRISNSATNLIKNAYGFENQVISFSKISKN